MSNIRAYSATDRPVNPACRKIRAPSRCVRIPSARAKAVIRSITASSNASPVFLRTGDSIEMTETGVATRPLAVRSSSARTSSRVKVARPGASGISLMLLRVWRVSPVSLYRWLSAWTIARLGPPASARTARWLASVPVGMKMARSLPSAAAKACSSSSTTPPLE